MNLNTNNNIFNENFIDNDCYSTKKKRKIRNKFTLEEDQKLRELVQKHGEHSWNLISSLMENRNQRQCRERWKHYLSCDLNEASKPWSKEEDKILLKRYNELGGKWTKIARELPGRSDLQVKIRFMNHINKKNRHKLDSDEYEISDDCFEEYGDKEKDLENNDIQTNENDFSEQQNDETQMEINQQNPFIAESIHAAANLADNLNFSINFDLTPSNIISEYFQYDESSILFQTFENEFLNWSFE